LKILIHFSVYLNKIWIGKIAFISFQSYVMDELYDPNNFLLDLKK